tara:strand:+ start:4290 stop:4496 length:207 start_codon:yes stop_codon:yes gene_type:complete
MFKIFKYIFLFLILSNCTSPGTALLGPAFTGLTSKSIAKTGLSYSTNQIIKGIDIIPEKNKDLFKFQN